MVIVGGGFGGIAAASQLQALNVPFMLVDMKDSFHHNVAALRASVESGELLLYEPGLVLGYDVRAGVVFSILGQVAPGIGFIPERLEPLVLSISHNEALE